MALIAPLDPLSFSLIDKKEAPGSPDSLQQQQLINAQTQQAQSAAQANQAQALQAQAKAAVEQQKAQREQEFFTAIKTVGANPTSEQIGALMGQYPEKAAELKHRADQLSQQDKDVFVAQSLPLLASMTNNRPDLTLTELGRLEKAHINKGQTEQAKTIRSMADRLQKEGLTAVNGELAGYLMAIMGKDRYDGAIEGMNLGNTMRKRTADTLEAEEKARRAKLQADADADTRSGLLAKDWATVRKDTTQAAQNAASTAKLKAETETENQLRPGKGMIQDLAIAKELRAGQLDQPEREIKVKEQNAATRKAEQDRLAKELRPHAQIRLNQLTDEIKVATAMRARASGLANKFDLKTGFNSSGLPARTAEAIKSFWGTQDNRTSAMKLYDELRVTKAAALLKNFKPASDSDSTMVFRPFPEPTDDPKYVAAFIRSMDAVAEMQNKINDTEKQFISVTKGTGTYLGEKPFTINGVKVNSGDTLELVQEKIAAQLSPEEVKRLEDLKKKFGGAK